MVLLAADDTNWILSLIRDGGPMGIASALLIIGCVVIYRYAGRPTLEMLRDITNNCTRAAHSNSEAAKAWNEGQRILSQTTERLHGIGEMLERQVDRLDTKRG